MDASKTRAIGPWVLVKPEGAAKITSGGIHLPDDNAAAKVGYGVARVVSVGNGYWAKTGGNGSLERTVFKRQEVGPGDRVAYRIHLQNSCKFDDHSFIHMEDLELYVGDDVSLNPALPYDN